MRIKSSCNILWKKEEDMMGKDIKKTLVKAWNYKWIYLMLLPVVVYFLVFRYAPMYGITIAFKDYNIFKGIFDSPWIGFKVFEKVFANKNFWLACRILYHGWLLPE